MISLYLIASHMTGDYLFQTAAMAASKLRDWHWRAAHCFVYVGCFVPVAVAYGGQVRGGAFLLLLWLTHFAIDSKRWRTANPWPAMPILHDQSLHAVQLAVLAGILL